MKTKRKSVLIAIAVGFTHLALSVWLFFWAFGIAMAHDNPDPPPLTSGEKTAANISAVVNLPLMTLNELGTVQFAKGYWIYSLFVVDSVLWACCWLVFTAVHQRKLKGLPNKSQEGIATNAANPQR